MIVYLPMKIWETCISLATTWMLLWLFKQYQGYAHTHHAARSFHQKTLPKEISRLVQTVAQKTRSIRKGNNKRKRSLHNTCHQQSEKVLLRDSKERMGCKGA
jgi:hypothetical protein